MTNRHEREDIKSMAEEKREAFRMHLKPGCEEEYERRHRAIWPEVKKMISESGVYDYSIYLDKETGYLFAFQKTKGDKAMRTIPLYPYLSGKFSIWIEVPD